MPSAPLSLLLAGALAALTACGGGGGSASIGGTITGLNNGLTLVLQNNSADNFSITGNGATSYTYRFATPLSSGNAYSVTVLTQPLGETCTVTNATGSVDSSGDSVSSVAVNCGITSSVVGNITGLVAGAFVTLTLGGTATPVTANGSFALPGILTAGSTYTVTISQQPNGQTCTLTNGTGTVVANTPQTVTVTCS